MNPLHRAAIDNDLPAIDRLIAEGSDPRALDANGLTPLILAASHGRAAAVERLLPLSDPNARDGQDDWTALDHALGAARLDAVRLLAPKTDLRALDSEGRTPLMRAAKFLDAEAVDALLPFSDPLQANDRGQIALHLAAMRNCDEAVFPAALVTPEAVNARDKAGCTPLYFACMAGNAAAVRTLLACPQCDPFLFDKDGRSPLGLAADFVGVKLLKPFAERLGSDLPLAAAGENPLAFAAALPGNAEGVEFLAPFFDRSLFPEALRSAAGVGETGVIDFLLPFVDNPGDADAHGETALMVAAANGKMDAIKRLAQVSDVNFQNDLGHGALHRALLHEQHDAVGFLVPLSDRSQKTADGESLMHFALFNPHGPSPFDSAPSWRSVVALFPYASAVDQEVAMEKCPFPDKLGQAMAEHEERVLRSAMQAQAHANRIENGSAQAAQPVARKPRSL